jgi:hypothetical protein
LTGKKAEKVPDIAALITAKDEGQHGFVNSPPACSLRSLDAQRTGTGEGEVQLFQEISGTMAAFNGLNVSVFRGSERGDQPERSICW